MMTIQTVWDRALDGRASWETQKNRPFLFACGLPFEPTPPQKEKEKKRGYSFSLSSLKTHPKKGFSFSLFNNRPPQKKRKKKKKNGHRPPSWSPGQLKSEDLSSAPS